MEGHGPEVTSGAHQHHATLLHDVKKIVNPGLTRAFHNHELFVLPQLKSVTSRASGTSALAIIEAIRLTVREAVGQLGATSGPALEALLALESNPTTVERRQQDAADVMGLQTGKGFKAHKQPGLLEELVNALEYIEEKGAEPKTGGNQLVVEWPALQTAIVRLHARIDREFQPEIIITMSGPGSFAACYFLSLSSRDVPLVMCTTFPTRANKLPAHQVFADSAGAADWFKIEPSKWTVYVPNVVSKLPAGYRVLLLDDRVMTGESQQLLKTELHGRFGLDVRCAAVLTHSKSANVLDWFGNVIDDDYVMPWGARRGRE